MPQQLHGSGELGGLIWNSIHMISSVSFLHIMLKCMHFEIDFITWVRRSDIDDDDAAAMVWYVTWSELIGDHCVTEYVIRYQKLTATRIQWNLRQGRTRCAPWPLKPTPGAAPVLSYLMALSCKLGATSTVLSKFVTSSLVLQVWSLTTSMKKICHSFLFLYDFTACPDVIWGRWESHIIGHNLLPVFVSPMNSHENCFQFVHRCQHMLKDRFWLKFL